MKKALSLLLCICLCFGAVSPAFAADHAEEMTGWTVVIVTSDIRGDVTLYPYIAGLKAHCEQQGAAVLLADGGNLLRGAVRPVTDMCDGMAELLLSVGYAVIAAADGVRLISEEPEQSCIVTAATGMRIAFRTPAMPEEDEADAVIGLYADGSCTVELVVYDETGELLVVTPVEFDETSPVDERIAAEVDAFTEQYGDITQNDDFFYVDVPEDAVYLDALSFVSAAGLMNGTGEGRFEPEAAMTRATFATVLWRYYGKPSVPTTTSFSDADEDWYLDAIAWAESTEAIKGYGNGVFGCDDPVTRQDAATILWRLMGEPETDDAHAGCTDLDKVEDYAYDAVKWALLVGVLDAIDGEIQPARVATRAELAELLMNYDAVVRAAEAPGEN